MLSPSAWLHVAVNLQTALQAFLLQLRADGRAKNTLDQYRRHGSALVAWLAATGIGTDIVDLTPNVLATFFASDAARSSCRGGPKKAVSLNAMRTSVRCFAAHLHLSGLVAQNPARMLRRARCTAPAPRALHADEQERLLAVLAAATGVEAERDRVLVHVLLRTGARLGSALALDVSDLDFEHGELTMRSTKNDKPAVVMLPKALGEELRRFVAGRKGPVFLAKDARISTRHAQRRLAGWFAKARITGKSAQSIRHAFATDLLARTGDLRLVQAALNHASIVSTTIYTAVDRARLRAAVGASPDWR